MKEVQLRDAKAALSALIEAAENGDPTTITKRGRPAAVVVSYEEWTRLQEQLPTFADLLLSMPSLEDEDLPERMPPRIARTRQT